MRATPMRKTNVAIGVEAHQPAREPAQGLRIDAMLLFEHARGERFLVVCGQHGYGSLDDDGTRIELWGDEVHRASMYAHAGLQRSTVRMQTGKRRQQ